MIWKKIERFPNYSVSDEGMVRNDLTGRILKSFNGSTGYKILHLSKDGNKKTVKLHRLIAEAFIPNKSCLKCVNHINGDKQDNRIENLEWCSHSENNIHSYQKLGRSSANAVHAMTVAKFKPVLCVESGAVYRSIKEASEKTGTFHQNISACLSGNRKTAGGYHWGYAT